MALINITKNKGSLFLLWVLMGIGLQASNALAAAVTFGVDSASTYSSNTDLSLKGAELDELSLSISPYAKYSKKGRRVDAILDYSFSSLSYARYDGRNVVNHQARANVEVRPIVNELTLSFIGAHSQSVINSQRAFGVSDLFRSDNTTNVFTGSVVPVWHRVWNPNLYTRVAAEVSGINYEKDVADSGHYGFDIEIGGDINRTGIRWLMSFADDIDLLQGQDDSEVQVGRARLTVPLSSQVHAFVEVGEERRRIQQPKSVPFSSSNNWLVGMNGAMSRRTHWSVEAGESFSGETYGVSLTHQMRRSTFTFSYDEELMSSLGNVLSGESDGNAKLANQLFLVTNELYEAEAYSASWLLAGRYFTLNVNASRVKRLYQRLQFGEVAYNFNSRLDYRFSDKTTITHSLSCDQLGPELDQRIDNLWSTSLEVNRIFSPKISVYGKLNLAQRDNPYGAILPEYEEWTATLGVNASY